MAIRQAIANGVLWLKELTRLALSRREIEPLTPRRHYLFYRDAGRICVCDVTSLIGSSYPGYPVALVVGDHEYSAVGEKESFFFWNEFLNAAGETIGYEFDCPPQVLRESYLLSATENVELSDFEARILLVNDPQATWDCV